MRIPRYTRYTVLCCTVLYFTILHDIILSCAMLHCTVLYCTVLYRTRGSWVKTASPPFASSTGKHLVRIPGHTVLYYTRLHDTVLHCAMLQ